MTRKTTITDYRPTHGICHTLNKNHFSTKKIYDEVTEDVFDMSNVIIFKQEKKKNGGCLYFVMSLVS